MRDEDVAQISPYTQRHLVVHGHYTFELASWSAPEQLRSSGAPVRAEEVARLSPLGHAHLNCLGRYAFTTQPPAELRPPRDPNARDGEDDEF